MALYDYRCKACGERWTEPTYGIERYPHDQPEDYPCMGQVVRVFSFVIQRGFEEHFNPGVGRVVKSRTQLDDHLKRKSEEVTARTGIPHDFKQADLRDRDIFPVTMEGLDATYDRHDVTSPVRKAIETV